MRAKSKMGQGIILEAKEPRVKPWLRILSLVVAFTFILQTTGAGYLFAEESKVAPLVLTDELKAEKLPDSIDTGLGDEFYDDYGSYDEDGNFVDPYDSSSSYYGGSDGAWADLYDSYGMDDYFGYEDDYYYGYEDDYYYGYEDDYYDDYGYDTYDTDPWWIEDSTQGVEPLVLTDELLAETLPDSFDTGLGDEFYDDYGTYDDDGNFIDPYSPSSDYYGGSGGEWADLYDSYLVDDTVYGYESGYDDEFFFTSLSDEPAEATDSALPPLELTDELLSEDIGELAGLTDYSAYYGPYTYEDYTADAYANVGGYGPPADFLTEAQWDVAGQPNINVATEGGTVDPYGDDYAGADLTHIVVDDQSFYYSPAELTPGQPNALFLDPDLTEEAKSWIASSGDEVSRQPEIGETRDYATFPALPDPTPIPAVAGAEVLAFDPALITPITEPAAAEPVETDFDEIDYELADLAYEFGVPYEEVFTPEEADALYADDFYAYDLGATAAVEPLAGEWGELAELEAIAASTVEYEPEISPEALRVREDMLYDLDADEVHWDSFNSIYESTGDVGAAFRETADAVHNGALPPFEVDTLFNPDYLDEGVESEDSPLLADLSANADSTATPAAPDINDPYAGEWGELAELEAIAMSQAAEPADNTITEDYATGLDPTSDSSGIDDLYPWGDVAPMLGADELYADLEPIAAEPAAEIGFDDVDYELADLAYEFGVPYEEVFTPEEADALYADDEFYAAYDSGAATPGWWLEGDSATDTSPDPIALLDDGIPEDDWMLEPGAFDPLTIEEPATTTGSLPPLDLSDPEYADEMYSIGSPELEGALDEAFSNREAALALDYYGPGPGALGARNFDPYGDDYADAYGEGFDAFGEPLDGGLLPLVLPEDSLSLDSPEAQKLLDEAFSSNPEAARGFDYYGPQGAGVGLWDPYGDDYADAYGFGFDALGEPIAQDAAAAAAVPAAVDPGVSEPYHSQDNETVFNEYTDPTSDFYEFAQEDVKTAYNDENDLFHDETVALVNEVNADPDKANMAADEIINPRALEYYDQGGRGLWQDAAREQIVPGKQYVNSPFLNNPGNAEENSAVANEILRRAGLPGVDDTVDMVEQIANDAAAAVVPAAALPGGITGDNMLGGLPNPAVVPAAAAAAPTVPAAAAAVVPGLGDRPVIDLRRGELDIIPPAGVPEGLPGGKLGPLDFPGLGAPVNLPPAPTVPIPKAAAPGALDVFGIGDNAAARGAVVPPAVVPPPTAEELEKIFGPEPKAAVDPAAIVPLEGGVLPALPGIGALEGASPAARGAVLPGLAGFTGQPTIDQSRLEKISPSVIARHEADIAAREFATGVHAQGARNNQQMQYRSGSYGLSQGRNTEISRTVQGMRGIGESNARFAERWLDDRPQTTPMTEEEKSALHKRNLVNDFISKARYEFGSDYYPWDGMDVLFDPSKTPSPKLRQMAEEIRADREMSEDVIGTLKMQQVEKVDPAHLWYDEKPLPPRNPPTLDEVWPGQVVPPLSGTATAADAAAIPEIPTAVSSIPDVGSGVMVPVFEAKTPEVLAQEKFTDRTIAGAKDYVRKVREADPEGWLETINSHLFDFTDGRGISEVKVALADELKNGIPPDNHYLYESVKNTKTERAFQDYRFSIIDDDPTPFYKRPAIDTYGQLSKPGRAYVVDGLMGNPTDYSVPADTVSTSTSTSTFKPRHTPQDDFVAMDVAPELPVGAKGIAGVAAGDSEVFNNRLPNTWRQPNQYSYTTAKGGTGQADLYYVNRMIDKMKFEAPDQYSELQETYQDPTLSGTLPVSTQMKLGISADASKISKAEYDALALDDNFIQDVGRRYFNRFIDEDGKNNAPYVW